MNERAIFHKPESNYCFATSEKNIVLRLRLSREDEVKKVFVIYGCKYDFFKVQKQKEMKKRYEDKLFVYYETELELTDVRLTYVFKIISFEGRYFYSEDGLTEKYNFKYNFYNCFQYAYINNSDVHKKVGYMDNALFYEIFVDRFRMGNIKKDTSYINMKWGDKPTPKSFLGGDLEGIRKELKYIKKLGVNALYLTPIFKSISNHKYDIEDYFEIDEQFGSKEDLKNLVIDAHKEGIKVVLDAVFNHISERNALYKDVLEKGKESKYYDWFIFKNGKCECFSSCSYMPKLNCDNKEVQDYLIKVGKYYIEEFDIDGWRLDVSDEVSHAFWKRFRKEIKETKEEVVLIGENWHDANSYLRGDEFDSIMNYAFTKALLDYLAFDKFDSSDISAKLNELLTRNTSTVNKMMLNLLDSHDTLRFYTEVNNNLDKYLIAIALLFFYEGVPCIYYGDESLMEGGYDPDSRRGFVKNVDNEAYNLIKKLAHIRRYKGFINSKLYISSENGLLILNRVSSKVSYKLVINNSSRDIIYKATNVITSNRYESQKLKKRSFVIERVVL